MWNVIQNEIPVGANQTGNANVPVIDPQIIALANKALDDLDHWALAKIVRSRLEAEAQNTDSQVPSFNDELQTASDLHFVAGQNGT